MSLKEKTDRLLSSKKLVAIIAAAVAVLAVVCIFTVRAVRKNAEKEKIEEYLSQLPETYGELNIFSDAAEIDGIKNTLAGVKESFRQGADVVTLDLCFSSSDVPVICDDYDSITKDTLKLEEVLKLMNEEKYSALKINLRLRQLGSLSRFNELLRKYDMGGRVILSGIDKNRYTMISGEASAAGLFFDYVPPKDSREALNEILSMQEEYSVTGVIIDCGDITAELAELLNQRGVVFIIGGVHDELNMYSALSSGANNIETPSPEKLKEVFTGWKEQARENINQSVLDELNKK